MRAPGPAGITKYTHHIPNARAVPPNAISPASSVHPYSSTTAEIARIVPRIDLAERDDDEQPVALGDVMRMPRRAAVLQLGEQRSGELEGDEDQDDREGRGRWAGSGRSAPPSRPGRSTMFTAYARLVRRRAGSCFAARSQIATVATRMMTYPATRTLLSRCSPSSSESKTGGTPSATTSTPDHDDECRDAEEDVVVVVGAARATSS